VFAEKEIDITPLLAAGLSNGVNYFMLLVIRV